VLGAIKLFGGERRPSGRQDRVDKLRSSCGRNSPNQILHSRCGRGEAGLRRFGDRFVDGARRCRILDVARTY
jgi:hypothetical protein